MIDQLKPCPFCGGEASANGVCRWSRNPNTKWLDGTEVLEAFYVNCIQCQGRNSGNCGGFQTRAEAIEHWNTHAPFKGAHWMAASKAVTLVIPMLPPSVNTYTRHTRSGRHYKSAETEAWEWAFASLCGHEWVEGERFFVHITYTFGPKQHPDIDNLQKCVLDAIAKAGMLRSKKGKKLSDSHFKEQLVYVKDEPGDRQFGPKTVITIGAIIK